MSNAIRIWRCSLYTIIDKRASSVSTDNEFGYSGSTIGSGDTQQVHAGDRRRIDARCIAGRKYTRSGQAIDVGTYDT